MSESQETTKEIINLIATSNLCSYQIAYKLGINKRTIDKIGKEHLGPDIYNNKEKLALKKLSQEYMDGRKSGLGLYKLAEKLQVAKSTLFRIATNFPPVASSNNVQIISIEHPENNIENDFSDIESHPAPYTDYHKENEYRKSFRHRSFNDRKNEYAKLCINGVQISFNPLQENISQTISKIISVLQEA